MRAFTLVEIILAIGIGVTVLGGIILAFTSLNRVYHYQRARIELQEGLRSAIEGMIREIRQGRGINLENNGQGITFNIIGVNESIEYFLGDSKIKRRHPPFNMTIANNITDLCFCWNSTTNSCGSDCADVFTLRVRASKNVLGRDLSLNLTQKLTLRN